MKAFKLAALAVAGVLVTGAAACGDDDESTTAGGGGDVSGTIAIDGSSTVFPFAQAAAEQFQAENPDVQITVGQSGTTGGFEKFCAGEIDIADASRPVDSTEEESCQKEGIEFEEVQVANDGISVVTNPAVELECMTTDELKQLWEDGSEVSNLTDINPEFPDAELSLYGPGTDSGTFEFFTDQINGEEGSSRSDYQPSEDDNVLVQGVTGDEGGLGYFGFSYYEQNQDSLNLVSLDDGDGCVAPSAETIQSGEYSPLARPLFMYPSVEALQKPEVAAFMQYTLDNYDTIAENAQIVPMDSGQAEESSSTLEQASG